MKSIIAFLFVVGVCVNANPFHRYGWEDGMEYVFRYESQVLTGIPDIRKEQAAGVKLVSNVKVQSMADYTLRIKFEDPKLISFNEVIVPKTAESGRVLLKEVVSEGRVMGGQEEDDELPTEYKRYLMTPYLVRVKGGKIESFQVSQREPMEITNIKRAFLTQIYMDMSGYLYSGIEPQQVGEGLGRTEEILKKELSGLRSSSEGYREFVTYEEAIQGECKTIYSLSKVPEFKAIEMEELWRLEKDLYAREDHLEVAKGERFCEGKQYYKLTKTRDFNKCKVRPLYQKWIGMDGDCDLSKSSCGAIFGHMARASYYICGDLHDFTIRRMVMDDEKVSYPLVYRTDEKLKSVSKSTLDLLVKKPFTTPLPLPSDTRVERSLVYLFPSQLHHSHNGLDQVSEGIKESVISVTKEMFGFRPILPMPSLTKAPWSLVPRTLPEEEIVHKAAEVIRKISYLIYESPESCSSKEDVVGLLMTVVKHLRHLGMEHLKKLESDLEDHKQIFYEVLVKVGTNPAVMLFKERLLEGRFFSFLEESEIVHLVQGTIRNVRTPTPELMRELVKMVKHESISGRKSRSIFTVSLLQLSNLFYKSYIHPTYMYTKYPVRIYGVFGTNRSEVITSEYVPFLEHLIVKNGLESSSDSYDSEDIEEEKVKLVAIVALGKLGHMRSLKKLVEVVEDKRLIRQPFIRALAVYSMKRLAKRDPSQVKAILMPIIMNPAENDQVRIAAITILAYAQPTISQLQKLVMLTWEDKLSKQVASFVHSTIENLSHSPVPELIDTGRKASAVRHLLRPFNLGMQYSHNHHSENLIGYLDAIFSEKLHITNTRNGLLPTRVSLSKDLLGVFGAWKIKGPSFTAYIQGMDRIINELLMIVGQTERVSPEVKEQLRKIADELQMEKGKEYSPRTFILTRMFGFETARLLNIKVLMEVMEKAGASLSLSEESRKNFKLFRSYKVVEADTLGVSLIGLPYVFQSTSTFILTTNGTISTVSKGGLLKAKAKVLPIFNFKTQVDSGLLIPFTQKFVGASIDMGIHSSLAFEVEAKLERNEIKVAIRVPEERFREHTETLHGFVLPYTVISSYVSMKPTSLASTKKPILTGLPKKVVEKQIFPKSFGLHCELKLESDNEYIDFASYYHKVREHSLVSVMTFPAILVSTLRQTSTKIIFSPSKSETKELEFVIKLGSLMKGSSSISQKVEEIKESIARHEMHSLKEALESLTEDSKTHMLHLDAVLKGESGEKTIKAGIVIGHKPLSHHKTKSVLALDIKPGSLWEASETETYGFLWEGELEMPKIEYRWNVEKLLAQKLEMKLDSRIKFGLRHTRETGKEIKINARFFKTEKQMKSVRDSVEYKKCEQEIQEGKLLTPICMKVRHQAASLDKMVLAVEMSRTVSEMRLWKMLEGIVITEYFPMVKFMGHLPEEESSALITGEKRKVVIEGHIDRVGHFAEAKVKYGETEYQLQNIPVPKVIHWIMPISVRNNLYYWFLQRATSNQTPASCRIEPKFIGTFDNVTYPYQINDCGHVLVIDRKQDIPVAVMTRTYPTSGSGMEKSVKILAGKFDIELIPTMVHSNPIEVKVNQQQVSIERGQIFTEKSSKTGRVIFEVERYMDDVYHIFVMDQLLEVLTNGKHIEVVVPQTFRARSAGLCGDLNGEKTTDLKSPRMCVMKTKVAGIAYMLNKDGSDRGVTPRCSGIPSELKTEFEEEERECLKEQVIPTVLTPVLHRLHYLVRPKVSSHAIIITRFDICLSRETIAVSPKHHKIEERVSPSYRRPKVLIFVCLPKQSALAQSLLKRAQSGENLDSVLKRMPISFKKHIHGDVNQVEVPGLHEGSHEGRFEAYPYNYLKKELKHMEHDLEEGLHRSDSEDFHYGRTHKFHNKKKYLSGSEVEDEEEELRTYSSKYNNNQPRKYHHSSSKGTHRYHNGASMIEENEEWDLYNHTPRSNYYHASRASPVLE